MSKEGRARGGRGSGSKSAAGAGSGCPVPYSTITRRERSRKLAQKRRDIYKQIMDDMTSAMPFPKDVVAQLDYNSRLRLTICFFRMKTVLNPEDENEEGHPLPTAGLDDLPPSSPGEGCEPGGGAGGEEGMEGSGSMQMVVARSRTPTSTSLFKPGMLQDLMCEALDGFLMVTQLDGTIIFLSESIHKHLGLFQSEHIGVNMYELILDEDHEDVRQRISEADDRSVKRKTKHGTTDVSFFCRMKCSRFKLANTVSKSPGFKLVYVSGTLKVAGSEPFLACTVRPVSPPAVLELRMEGNMFVAHYSMANMSCIYFDGRLRHLLGYTRDDFIGKTPFDFQHHDDLEATMECSRQVQTQGKGLSGYYRFLNRFGEYIWIQSQAVVAFDSSGNPSHIVCTSYVISKEDGNRDLLLRQAIASGQSEFVEKTLAPENPFALKKQSTSSTAAAAAADDKDKNGTHPSSQRHKNGESSALLARLKQHKEQTTYGHHRMQTDSGERQQHSDSNSSSSSASKGTKSSLLYSMLSNGKVSPVAPKTTNSMKKSDNDRGSTTSLGGSSIHGDDPAIEKSPLPRQNNVSPPMRSQSVEVDDGFQIDSTTVSNQSSPYNPLSVQQLDEGGRAAAAAGGGGAGQSARTMSYSDRTMSGSDLGYYSESNSSMLRERISSTFTSCDSDYMCDAGTDISPPATCNPYSPDYDPLSVLSSDGSMASHVSFMTVSPTESHSQSLFHNPNSVHSSVGSPRYMLPMDECGSMYAQLSPGNQSVSSDHSDNMMAPGSVQKGSEVNLGQQQWSPGSSVVASSPRQQQYSPGSASTNGENPGNYSGGQRGLAYAKMDPSMILANYRTTFSPKPSPPSSGSQYINGSMPSILGKHSGATSSSSSSSASPAAGSLVLSDVFVTSVAGAPPRPSMQASMHSTNGLADLPQLTIEDLKMLDAFDQLQGSKDEDQFGQLLYQQTALSCRGTMMM